MNSYLETAIAVVLVIIIFSIVTYVFQELIAANLKFRGKMLKRSINQLLDNNAAISTFTNQFYNHPQIKKLQENLTELPSYVPSGNFALAVMDMVGNKAPGAAGTDLFKNFKSGISSFAGANGDLGILLKNFSDNSADLKELKTNIEKWYNDYMDRVTGWYKRKSTLVTRIIAVIVTLIFNLNMIVVTTSIHNNAALKSKLVATAEDFVDHEQNIKDKYLGNVDSSVSVITQSFQSTIDASKSEEAKQKIIQQRDNKVDSFLKIYNAKRVENIKSLLEETHVTELPIGWNAKSCDYFKGWGFLLALIGWFIGAAAISMGAPFWFDMLVKLVNVRRAGLKPEGKP